MVTLQVPCTFACADEKGENLNIEIDLPGIKKENIDFKMHDDSYTIRATDDDVKYAGTFPTCCPVVPEKAVAKYSREKLFVTVPFQEPHMKSVDVEIE